MKTYRKVRVSIVRETAAAPYSQPRTVRSGEDVVSLVRAFIGDDPREHFVAVYLDNKHQPIGIHAAHVGTVDSVSCHPREIFAPALHLCATRLVTAHNHPSGDPTPSAEDRAVTKRLRECGELLGIELLDDLVIGTERFYSFASEGFFPMPQP
jgi:DNA repair protein RadC